MISYAMMQAAKCAMDAYAKKDWDALAECVLPFLPKLPSDGGTHSDTETRAAFQRVLPLVDFPAPLKRAAERYLSEASDAQLTQLAGMIHALAGAIPKVTTPPETTHV